MTTLDTFSYIDWSAKILNEHLKTQPKWLATCSKVNRYTRAGQNGKFIICPHCNQGAFVFHFSWSALSCQHCDTMINKNDWKVEVRTVQLVSQPLWYSIHKSIIISISNGEPL